MLSVELDLFSSNYFWLSVILYNFFFFLSNDLIQIAQQALTKSFGPLWYKTLNPEEIYCHFEYKNFSCSSLALSHHQLR